MYIDDPEAKLQTSLRYYTHHKVEKMTSNNCGGIVIYGIVLIVYSYYFIRLVKKLITNQTQDAFIFSNHLSFIFTYLFLLAIYLKYYIYDCYFA